MPKFLSGKISKTLYTQLLFTVLAFAAMVVLSYVFMSSIVRRSLIRNANAILDFAEVRIGVSLSDTKTILDNFSDAAQNMILSGASADEIKESINELSYYASKIGGKAVDAKGFYGYFETLPGPRF